MKTEKALYILCGAILAAALITPVARPDDSVEPYSLRATIVLHSQSQVANNTLGEGTYHVVYEGNQNGNDRCAFVSPVKGQHQAAGFRRDGIIVAEVPCTVKTLQINAEDDSTVISQDRLTEVQFKGTSKAVDF